jgi:hypothetical protein
VKKGPVLLHINEGEDCFTSMDTFFWLGLPLLPFFWCILIANCLFIYFHINFLLLFYFHTQFSNCIYYTVNCFWYILLPHIFILFRLISTDTYPSFRLYAYPVPYRLVFFCMHCIFLWVIFTVVLASVHSTFFTILLTLHPFTPKLIHLFRNLYFDLHLRLV